MSAKKILANDGIHEAGKEALEKAGHIVIAEKIAQEELAQRLNEFDAIVVRSATKVRRELIDACPNLQVIARGGVGMDNIDVEYARSRGIGVYNTPSASSHSVAELVFAHALSLARFLHRSNREMPEDGATRFKELKKQYSSGIELLDKTIGIVGFGRIGQHVGRIALGLGMDVLAVDPVIQQEEIVIGAPGTRSKLHVNVETEPIEDILPRVDLITLHVPSQGEPILGAKEFAMMKKGVIVINASRGGIIDEEALIDALDKGIVAGAGLDVFEGEPSPREEILNHPKISLSPHIGASTDQAQINVGLELADLLITHFNGQSQGVSQT